jgi:leucyl aminopeptidase
MTVSDAGVKVTVYDEKRLAKELFNGVVTVGRGSNRPPRLVLMEYTPQRKSKIHLCLVGKAVTFDTGGHSLKPGKNMWEMKGDMAGGAAVIGAMQAIGWLRPDIAVTGIVPSALNAIGPEAMLPGDIIRSRSGKTVHVDNTDAEGRLLLMDALDFAQSRGATHIVDVATLTGSIVRALGEAMSGLFSNDDGLAEAISQCGTAVGEDYWRMPLIEEYREQLDHPVADMDNVGKGLNAGAIVAALFLKEFVSDSVKWAHLDIAASGLFTKNYKAWGPGGSGFGVQTLVALATRLSQSR